MKPQASLKYFTAPGAMALAQISERILFVTYCCAITRRSRDHGMRWLALTKSSGSRFIWNAATIHGENHEPRRKSAFTQPALSLMDEQVVPPPV